MGCYLRSSLITNHKDIMNLTDLTIPVDLETAIQSARSQSKSGYVSVKAVREKLDDETNAAYTQDEINIAIQVHKAQNRNSTGVDPRWKQCVVDIAEMDSIEAIKARCEEELTV